MALKFISTEKLQHRLEGIGSIGKPTGEFWGIPKISTFGTRFNVGKTVNLVANPPCYHTGLAFYMAKV